MFDFDNVVNAPNVAIQIPIAVAPFGNAASVGQLNFADDSSNLGFSNSLGLGQFDGLL
ncbi:MAG: hypothetical protein OER56_16240 [Hyphomicrobiales bacterium]|nr:hypothetical protein [Hyphomicrobiales bacterium]